MDWEALPNGNYKWIGTKAPAPDAKPPGVSNGYLTQHTATKLRSATVNGARTFGTKAKPTVPKPSVVSGQPPQPRPSLTAGSGSQISKTTEYIFTPRDTALSSSTGTMVASGIAVAGGTISFVAALSVPSLGFGGAMATFLTGGGVSTLIPPVVGSFTIPPVAIVTIIVVAVIILIWAIVNIINDLTTLKVERKYSIQTQGNMFSTSGTASVVTASDTATYSFPVPEGSTSRGGLQLLPIKEKVFGNTATVTGHIDVIEYWTISLSKGLDGPPQNQDVTLEKARAFLETQLGKTAGSTSTRRVVSFRNSREFVNEVTSETPPPDDPPPPLYLQPRASGSNFEFSEENEKILAANLQAIDDWKAANPEWDYVGGLFGTTAGVPMPLSAFAWKYPDPTNEAYTFFDTGQILTSPRTFQTKDMEIAFIADDSSYEFPVRSWWHYTFACKATIPFEMFYGAGMMQGRYCECLADVSVYSEAPQTTADKFCRVAVGKSLVPSGYALNIELLNLVQGTDATSLQAIGTTHADAFGVIASNGETNGSPRIGVLRVTDEPFPGTPIIVP